MITPADLREVDQIIIDGDINLITTLERVKKDEFLQEMTLKILKGDTIRYSRTYDIIYYLELAGAITKRGEFCKMRNTIYEKFFRQYFNLVDDARSLKDMAVCLKGALLKFFICNQNLGLHPESIKISTSNKLETI